MADEILITELPEFDDDQLEGNEEGDEVLETEEDNSNEEDDALSRVKVSKVENEEVNEWKSKAETYEREAKRYQEEVETERAEKYKAQQHLISNHIERLQSEETNILRSIQGLELDARQADKDGENDRYRDIQNLIFDKKTQISKINQEVEKYKPHLNSGTETTKKVEVKAEVKAETKQPERNPAFESWMASNQWIDDPAHAARRAKVNALIEEYGDQYGKNNPKLWKFIDGELNKKRVTPPSRGAGMDGESQKKKYKNESDILAHANWILSNRGIKTNHPNFKQLSDSACKTARNYLARKAQ